MNASPVTWLEISESDGRYLINDSGQVRGPSGKILKPTIMQIGYSSVALSLGNHRVIRRYIHRLVIEAFVGTIPSSHIVNHKNHDKLDNRLSNLEVIDRRSNARHWITKGNYRDRKQIPSEYCRRGHKKKTTISGHTHCSECRKLRANGHIWKPPAGTEWRECQVPGYLVSADGRVWTMKQSRVLAPSVGNSGYQNVCLTLPTCERKMLSVHRLVAAAFLGEIEAGLIVNHINGDKDDNSADNLELTSHSRNISEMHRIQRERGLRNLKHDDDKIAEMKGLLNTGNYTRREIANLFNISISYLSAIATGKQRHHIKPKLPSNPPLPKGSLRLNKFSDKKISEIKGLLNTGNYSRREIANLYKMSTSHLSSIATGKSRSDVEPV